MRGLKVLTFVETAGHVRRRFIGVCDCGIVRWRLTARFPWLEAALAHAESRVWPAPAPLPQQAFPIRVVNDEGRLELSFTPSPEPAANLLRQFLDLVQAPSPPLSGEWEVLPSDPLRIEHAQWLTGRDSKAS